MSASGPCRMAGRVWIQDHHASGHPPGGPRGSASCQGGGQMALKKPGCNDSHQSGLPSCGLLSAATWRESPRQNRLLSAEGPVRPPGWALGGAWETRSWLLPARGPPVAACLHHLCGLGCRNPSREAGRLAGEAPRPRHQAGMRLPQAAGGGHPSGLMGAAGEGVAARAPVPRPSPESERDLWEKSRAWLFLHPLFLCLPPSLSRLPGPGALGSLSP